MPPEIHPLSQTPITSHAFSADRQGWLRPQFMSMPLIISPELAVSLNSNDVQLYSRRDQEWIPTEVLSEVRH